MCRYLIANYINFRIMSTLTISYSIRDHKSAENEEKFCNENVIEKLIKHAKSDLREDESSRTECFQHFKEWIKQNSDISNCILGN